MDQLQNQPFPRGAWFLCCSPRHQDVPGDVAKPWQSTPPHGEEFYVLKGDLDSGVIFATWGARLGLVAARGRVSRPCSTDTGCDLFVRTMEAPRLRLAAERVSFRLDAHTWPCCPMSCEALRPPSRTASPPES